MDKQRTLRALERMGYLKRRDPITMPLEYVPRMKFDTDVASKRIVSLAKFMDLVGKPKLVNLQPIYDELNESIFPHFPRQEQRSMRDVTIKKVLNGFQVEVGCQTLVFNDKAVMFAELSHYIDNPEQVEKEYLERFSGGAREARVNTVADAIRSYDRAEPVPYHAPSVGGASQCCENTASSPRGRY